MSNILILSIALAFFILLIVILYYNKLVSFRNKVEEAWSSTNIQLKRRYDLIPNLLETVKGYANHEKEVFDKVTRLRTEAINAEGVEQQAEAENSLKGALKSIFAVAENYPDLKASANFVEFQGSLTEIENDIQLARRYYNAIVRDANTFSEKFPGVLFAGLFGFKKAQLFEIESEEAKNVKVTF